MSVATQSKAPAVSVNFTNKPEVIAALKRAAELKAIEKAGKDAEAERKQLEQDIIYAALGDAQVGIIRGVEAVKVRASSNSSVDKALLQSAFPEAFEATYRKTPYTFLQYNVPA